MTDITIIKVIQIRKKLCIENQKNRKRWLSPSSINAYIRCPRKFYYSKIAKLKQKPSIHLIRGIAVHNAIEKFYKYKVNQCADMEYSRLRKIVIELLRDEWLVQKKNIRKLDLSNDDLGFFVQESKKMMLNFLHDFIHNKGFEKKPPVIEKTLFSKKHKVLGRIDAIYNNKDPPLLVDFKTSKSKKVYDDQKRQLGIYALLYKENFNKLPDVAIHFLKFKDGLERFEVTDKFIEDIKILIADIHEKTQSDDIKDYPCTCGWCDKDFET
jgi:CRISPR/Cas system-associated exonuclease Cas4 (RecB family)